MVNIDYFPDVTPLPPYLHEEEDLPGEPESDAEVVSLSPAPSITPPPPVLVPDSTPTLENNTEKNGPVGMSGGEQQQQQQQRGTGLNATTDPTPSPPPADTSATKSYNKELRLTCFKLVKKPGRGMVVTLTL